jgi:hypothetical protein
MSVCRSCHPSTHPCTVLATLSNQWFPSPVPSSHRVGRPSFLDDDDRRRWRQHAECYYLLHHHIMCWIWRRETPRHSACFWPWLPGAMRPIPFANPHHHHFTVIGTTTTASSRSAPPARPPGVTGGSASSIARVARATHARGCEVVGTTSLRLEARSRCAGQQWKSRSARAAAVRSLDFSRWCVTDGMRRIAGRDGAGRA